MSTQVEEKQSSMSNIFNIVDQNALVGRPRKHSMLSTPDRICKSDTSKSGALHNGTKLDLLLQFTSVNDAEDCTPEWVEHNEEIFAASFARKCLRNLFAQNELKLREIMQFECAKQKNMRLYRKHLLRSMAREHRGEQKAKYRFLRTAVNSPSKPPRNNKNVPGTPVAAVSAPPQSPSARMLVSEFEILMRQFGVGFVDKAKLQTLFEAVKADTPDRNYITLEQFLAWYRANPLPPISRGTRKLSKWQSISSGSYDFSIARLSIIQYCIQAARAHGIQMFRTQLEDYRQLSTCASVLFLPPSPQVSPLGRSRSKMSGEQKVETPSEVLDSYFARRKQLQKVDAPSDVVNSYFAHREQRPGHGDRGHLCSKRCVSDEQLAVTLNVMRRLSETLHNPQASADSTFDEDDSGAETDDDFDLSRVASESASSSEPRYAEPGFDAAAYIEAACKEVLAPVSSADEPSSDYASDDEANNSRTSMSDGAKALIDSLLVFSEDGMDEIANHIESNRDDDQIAEEEFESFIGSLTDDAMTTFTERLEMDPDDATP